MCMHRIILLFQGCNFEVKCQCIREKMIAEDKVHVVLFDEGQKMMLRKIHVVFYTFIFKIVINLMN